MHGFKRDSPWNVRCRRLACPDTFTPPGPFTIGVVLALLGLIGAAILLLAFGLVLLLIAVVAIGVVALALSGRVRTWWRLTQN